MGRNNHFLILIALIALVIVIVLGVLTIINRGDNSKDSLVFNGIMCRGGTVSNAGATFEVGSDGTLTEDAISTAKAMCKENSSCQGIFIPPFHKKVEFVYDTSKCQNEIEYNDNSSKLAFGVLHFLKTNSCPEGYANPSNACRSRIQKECEPSEAELCATDQQCAKDPKGGVRCYNIDHKVNLKNKVAASYDDSDYNDALLEGVTGLTREQYLIETAGASTRDQYHYVGIHTQAEITAVNTGDTSAPPNEAITCFNGGVPVSIGGLQYCSCNNGEYYDGAVWGGARCQVKCPIWIDDQRLRLDAIREGKADADVPLFNSNYGSYIHPMKKGTGGGATDDSGKPIEGEANEDYDNFFRSAARRTNDYSIQSCGNETTADGGYIRRGDCLPMSTVQSSTIDSTCACMTAGTNWPEIGCRENNCDQDGCARSDGDNYYSGSCTWVPDEDSTRDYIGQTQLYRDEPTGGMKRCSCLKGPIPRDKFQERNDGTVELRGQVMREYSYDTTSHLADKLATPYGETDKRYCVDPCMFGGRKGGYCNTEDTKARCGIDDDNVPFCLCSKTHKGIRCTETNECDSCNEVSTLEDDITGGDIANRCQYGYTHTGSTGDDEFVPFPTSDYLKGVDLSPVTSTNATKCKCADKFVGTHCQFSNEETCNGNGEAEEDGVGYTCTCDAGAAGKNCEYTNTNRCNGRGEVKVNDRGEATCTCEPDTDGHECQFTRMHTCHNQGTPDVLGQCTCDWVGKVQYLGHDCAAPPKCPFQNCHSKCTVAGPDCHAETQSHTGSQNRIENALTTKAHVTDTHDKEVIKWIEGANYTGRKKGDAGNGTSNVCCGGYGTNYSPSDYMSSPFTNSIRCGDIEQDRDMWGYNKNRGMMCGVKHVSYGAPHDGKQKDTNGNKIPKGTPTNFPLDPNGEPATTYGLSHASETQYDSYASDDTRKKAYDLPFALSGKPELIVRRSNKHNKDKTSVGTRKTKQPTYGPQDPNTVVDAYPCTCESQGFYDEDDTEEHEVYEIMCGEATRCPLTTEFKYVRFLKTERNTDRPIRAPLKPPPL